MKCIFVSNNCPSVYSCDIKYKIYWKLNSSSWKRKQKLFWSFHSCQVFKWCLSRWLILWKILKFFILMFFTQVVIPPENKKITSMSKKVVQKHKTHSLTLFPLASSIQNKNLLWRVNSRGCLFESVFLTCLISGF